MGHALGPGEQRARREDARPVQRAQLAERFAKVIETRLRLRVGRDDGAVLAGLNRLIEQRLQLVRAAEGSLANIDIAHDVAGEIAYLLLEGELPTADELAWAVEVLLDPEADILHGSVLYLDAGGHRGIH